MRNAVKLLSIVFVLLNPYLAIAQPVPLSDPGPVQVSGVEVNGGMLTWAANTEADLQGYLVHYSVNTGVFIFEPIQYIDVGNVTQFDVENDSRIDSLRADGNTIYWGVSAYDSAGTTSAYDEGADNRSGIASTTDSGGEVASNFTLDVPPAMPSGLGVN